MTALHAGHAVRADLFLVDEQAQIGVYRGLVGIEQRSCSRIGANTVVVAVSANQRTIKADVAGVERRNTGQLSRQEISLGHAVFCVQVLQNGVLDAILGRRLRCFRSGTSRAGRSCSPP